MQYKSNKRNALERIKISEIPITCIIDIGVERQTGELLAEFPDKVHHLFEPVTLFYPEIRANYSKVEFVLHEMALSNETQSLYCKGVEERR